jgi:hypothetical protein
LSPFSHSNLFHGKEKERERKRGGKRETSAKEILAEE